MDDSILNILNIHFFLFQFSRSLSTGNAPPNVCQSTADTVVQRNISPSEYAPGSPYRTTSSTGLYLSTSDSVATGGARSYLNNSTGKKFRIRIFKTNLNKYNFPSQIIHTYIPLINFSIGAQWIYIRCPCVISKT